MDERTTPVTRDEINALADKIEAAGQNYQAVIEECDDHERLREASMELLLRAMGKGPDAGFFALTRDEIIHREMFRVHERSWGKQ